MTVNNLNLFSSIKKSPIKNNKAEFRLLEILGIDYDKNKKIIVFKPRPIEDDMYEEEEEW